jgi:hypothetical protein
LTSPPRPFWVPIYFLSSSNCSRCTMLSRSSLSRNAPRALSAGRRAMASAANPSFQYDVTEAAGVKVANREVAGPTGTIALVAKAGSRYQPFPGFADALEKFAFKVRCGSINRKPAPPSRPIPTGHLQVDPLNSNMQPLNRLPSSARHCGSLVRSSCWAVRSRRHTLAKTSSSVPSSSQTTSHTSQSCWPRLPANPSLLVSWIQPHW